MYILYLTYMTLYNSTVHSALEKLDRIYITIRHSATGRPGSDFLRYDLKSTRVLFPVTRTFKY
jgi:hypothetical protein